MEQKKIFDQIHGYIGISGLANSFIDTLQFQRLRHIHQLGTCHYVFPSATHTRFEHSIGTYHLSKLMLESIKKNSDCDIVNECLNSIPELSDHFKKTGRIELDDYVCELVNIAGLCHDIGHGPFSHVFDDSFLKEVTQNNELEQHENRSCFIIKYIWKNNERIYNHLTEDEVNFICQLINPPKNKHGFMYQIISNSFNGIDVDKFDYIRRDSFSLGLSYSIDIERILANLKVIDNNICFSNKIYSDITSIFVTRFRLHKNIYTHKTVVATQNMMNDILIKINKYIDAYDSIKDINLFTDLTDEYVIVRLKLLMKDIDRFSDSDKKNIQDAYNLWIRLNQRNLYKIAESSISTDQPDLNLMQSKYKYQNIFIFQTKIGYLSGNKDNPLDNIYFYSKNNNECFKIEKQDSFFQQYVTMVFYK